MLQLTQPAADLLDEVRTEQDIPDTHGIRLAAQQGPDGQVGLAIGFSEEPAESDQVSEQSGTEVYVAEELVEPLSTSVLDIEETPEGTGLTLRPQEDGSGGE